MEECISKATMESYNSDLCVNKISDLMMITLKIKAFLPRFVK
jgi:hypothetical protein